MRKHPIILLLIELFMFSGCIERYYPDEDELNTGTLVVVAQLSSIPGIQSVFLSNSTTLKYPGYDPLSDCYVEVMDSEGTIREMVESNPGEYSGLLDESSWVSTRHIALPLSPPMVSDMNQDLKHYILHRKLTQSIL